VALFGLVNGEFNTNKAVITACRHWSALNRSRVVIPNGFGNEFERFTLAWATALGIVATAGWEPVGISGRRLKSCPFGDSELAICMIRFGNPDLPYLINLHLIDVP